MAKLKLLKDTIGCCICEDCAKYSVKHKLCTDDRKQADAPDECKDFLRAYGIIGATFGTEDYD